MKKIVLAGGSGFLGKILSQYFVANGYHVIVLSRHHHPNKPQLSFYKWDARTMGFWADQLDGATALVNLNGKSVDCRYSEENKQLIYDTRLDSTYVLGKAIAGLKSPPGVWINITSATIYRHATDRPMDEMTGEFEDDTSVDVCKKWEEVFFQARTPDVRKVALRTAIVLGRSGGALQPLKRLVQTGMGGKQGKGDQYVSWLHERDFARIVDHLISREPCTGVYNAVSPGATPNSQFMKVMRQHLGLPIGLPMPEWLLTIGAWLIGTETELILKSRWVVPGKLLGDGFEFAFPDLEKSLRDLLGR